MGGACERPAESFPRDATTNHANDTNERSGDRDSRIRVIRVIRGSSAVFASLLRRGRPPMLDIFAERSHWLTRQSTEFMEIEQ